MEAIGQEVYEQVKAQVLEELKEERRARAKALKEEQEAIFHMFDPFRQKYYLRLVRKYELIKRYQTNLHSPERTIEIWCEEVEEMTLRRMHERNAKLAFRHGRADEANKIAMEIMETILQDKKEKA
ncbi:MAG: hypothetical protein K2L51_00535 [Clostridiales bacterium]|nr:hypothetical protein [Clostridiales bacterium]